MTTTTENPPCLACGEYAPAHMPGCVAAPIRHERQEEPVRDTAPGYTPTTAETPLAVGFELFVHAFGSWYAGRVARMTPTRVEVAYTTGSGETHVKTCQQVGDPLLSLTKPEHKRAGRRSRWAR